MNSNDYISPKYFELSDDQTIVNCINKLSAKAGTNTWTSREQNIVSVAIVTGRERGLIEAYRVNVGFNWSAAYTKCCEASVMRQKISNLLKAK